MDTFTETVFKILSSDADEQTGSTDYQHGAIALIEIPSGVLFAPPQQHAEVYTGPSQEQPYWQQVSHDACAPDGAPGCDLPEPGWYVTYTSDAGIITWQGHLTRDDARTLFGSESDAYAEWEDADREDI